MTTPGSGPQPPEQPHPDAQQPQVWAPPAGQPAQPAPIWGAPGQPAPGQPGEAGHQAWAPPGEQKKSRRWVRPVGGLVAVVAVLAIGNSFLGGGGDPKVGDCIHPKGTSEYETVDCDSDNAEAKIVGQAKDVTGNEFDSLADEDLAALCTKFPTATSVLWSGKDKGSDGHLYCAADN